MSSAGQFLVISPGSARPQNGSFRDGAGHRHGARDEFVEGRRGAVARRDDRLLLADQHAQAEVLALRALELLGLAEPSRMRQRGAGDRDRVRGVRPGLLRLGDEIASAG